MSVEALAKSGNPVWKILQFLEKRFFKNMNAIAPQTAELSDYLEATSIVQSDHPRIVEQARTIVGSATSEIEKARALFEWVRDEIPHSRDADRQEVPCSALDVLEAGTGLCYAKAHLLAAFMRASGIVCGFCYQTFDERRSLHGLNGVYLSELKKWIRIDPRGNSPRAKQFAYFDLENDIRRLAFPDDPFIDDIVYVAPLPQVASSLSGFDRLDDLWGELPTAKAH